MVYCPSTDSLILFGGSSPSLHNDTWSYDYGTNTWVNRSNGVAPTGRSETGMTFDSKLDRVLLFGGAYDNGTWSFDPVNYTWSILPTTHAPPPHGVVALTYDSSADRVILYGGTNSLFVADNETWDLDPTSGVWTAETPALSPPALIGPALTYDPSLGRSVLFGGATGSLSVPIPSSQTWTFDTASQSWTRWATASAPTPRWTASLSDGAPGAPLLLFGGFASVGFADYLWSFNSSGRGWSDLSPPLTPTFSSQGMLAVDTRASTLIWAGGSDSRKPIQTWTMNLSSQVWVNASTPLVGSPAIWGMASAYDPRADKTLSVGGLAGLYASNLTWSYDLATDFWSSRAHLPTPGYLGIIDASMTYDSRADRMILAGGALSTGSHISGNPSVYIYDYTNDSWSVLAVAGTSPQPRVVPALAYDSRADRVILFGGGIGNGSNLRDTWALDLTNKSWTNLSVPPGPSDDNWGSMVYDPTVDRCILLGSSASGTWRPWELSYANRSWTADDPASHANLSSIPSAALDPTRHRVISFGGGSATVNLTWGYDLLGKDWSVLSAPGVPPSSASGAFAVDVPSGTALFVGGASPYAAHPANETWSYNLDHNVWTMALPPTAPPAVTYSAFAYDSHLRRLVMFGGVAWDYALGSSIVTNQTWSYDFVTKSWTNLTQPPSPPARAGATMTYDARLGEFILFGGESATHLLNETWAFNESSQRWQNLTGGSEPPPRYLGSLAYDPIADRALLVGGLEIQNGTPMFGGDTWTLDANTHRWSPVASPLTPPGRADGGLAFDPSTGRIVLFGGLNGSVCLGDTWSLTLQMPAWSPLAPSTSPPPSAGFALGSDDSRGRLIEFGSCNAASQTWSFVGPAVAPSVVPGLSAASGGGEVRLGWSPPLASGGTPITGFRLYRGATAGGESLLATLPNRTSYVDTNVTNGLAYFYRVSAVNSVGEGAESPEASATPEPLAVALQASVTNGVAPLAVSFSSTVSGGLAPYSLRWTFGDTSASTAASPTHTYQAAGTYGVNCTVMDAQGETATRNLTVIVVLPLSVSVTASPASGPAPLAVVFTAAATGGREPYTFVWSFGDGYESTLASPSHTYAGPGTYGVRLTITDTFGRTSNATSVVTVAAATSTHPGGALGGGYDLAIALGIAAVAVAVLAIWLRRSRRTPAPSPQQPENPTP